MPAPDSGSDDQLRFARETPFTFGSWRDVKSLYKRLEAEPSSSPTALAALIQRIDSASLVPVRDIPTAAIGLSYNTGTPESIAVRGTRMAVIAQGWQSSGLYLYDFATPDILKPRTIGKITKNGRGDWDEVIFAGNHLLCVRVNDGQIKLFDISQDGKPVERGVFPEKPDQAPSHQAQNSGFSLLAAAEQMVKSAFGVAPSSPPENTLKFANLQNIASEGRFVYVTCGAAGGKKSTSLGGLFVVDVSEPDQPQLVGSVAVEDAERVVVVPGRTLLAVLSNPRNGGRQSQGSLRLIDISDPQHPQITATQAISHGSVLTAAEDFLYVSTSNTGSNSSQGIRIVDITNPRALRLVGTVPLTGYYGVENLAHREGYLYASMRYGRIQVIDVRDANKPERLRELTPSYVKGLQIVGDRLYSGVSASVALWSLQTPDRPALIGTPPSAATLGYMKRRARRLLKNLAKSDPALFTSLVTQILSEADKKFTLDWKTNWVLIDLLYGEGGRIDQVSHGRGRMVELRPRGLRLHRREERGHAAWDAHPENAAILFSNSNTPWQAREMALMILRAAKQPVPVLPAKVLLKCIVAPSLLLVAEAVRQSITLAQTKSDLTPELAAEAFSKASPRQRTQLLSVLIGKTSIKAEWKAEFTEAVLTRLPSPATDGSRPSKRSAAIAVALFENFADSVASVKGNPTLRLIPWLLSSGHALLRDQAIQSAKRISPKSAFDWLSQLSLIANSDDQEQILLAIEAAIRGTAVPPKLDDTIRQVLHNNETATIAWGWRLLSALAPTPDFLRSLWTALLSDTTLENALQVAMASPYALTLLGKSGITNDEMSQYLQERPVLIGLLSAQSFAVLTQSMPASVTLRMITAATDEAWTRLREGWLRNLREGIGVTALWISAEEALKSDATGNLERRLIDDPEVAVTIRDADDIGGILAIREPSLAPLLGDFVNHHIEKIAANDAFLLTAATHPLPEVRDPGLAALEKRTIRLPMALGLLESEVPASIAAGSRWFEETPEPDQLTRALALCDSPVASVRTIGRDYVTAHREQLPLEELSEALVEHADPKMQAFVARLLGNEPAPQFDREVLRTRNKGREAKEMVKNRQEALAAADGTGVVDTATLLALARGASTPRDSDWALTQLVQRAMAGESIEGLTLESAATAAAKGER
jgi:hypothetical protein